jgi:hypothetical protein
VETPLGTGELTVESEAENKMPEEPEKERYLVVVKWKTKLFKKNKLLRTVLDCGSDHRKATGFAEHLWDCAEHLWDCAEVLIESIEVVLTKTIDGYH